MIRREMLMKRKTIFICIAVLCVMALGIGATAMSLSTWNHKIKESKTWRDEDGWLMKDFHKFQNTDIEKITIYDFGTFFLKCPRWSVNLDSNSAVNSLQLMNEVYPVDYIYKIDENNICVVYRFSYDYLKYDTTYAFVFFQKQIVEDKMEEWHRTGEVYFANSLLNSESYGHITEGVSAEELLKLDIGVAYDYCYGGREFIRDVETSEIIKISFTTWRVLSDGVLIVTAEKPYIPDSDINNLTEYKVSHVELIPYGSKEMPKWVTIKDFDILSCFR